MSPLFPGYSLPFRACAMHKFAGPSVAGTHRTASVSSRGRNTIHDEKGMWGLNGERWYNCSQRHGVCMHQMRLPFAQVVLSLAWLELVGEGSSHASVPLAAPRTVWEHVCPIASRNLACKIMIMLKAALVTLSGAQPSKWDSSDTFGSGKPQADAIRSLGCFNVG